MERSLELIMFLNTQHAQLEVEAREKEASKRAVSLAEKALEAEKQLTVAIRWVADGCAVGQRSLRDSMCPCMCVCKYVCVCVCVCVCG
jgi:hypothetical protein